jgi:multidrug transporter EmrE-like cation transporter
MRLDGLCLFQETDGMNTLLVVTAALTYTLGGYFMKHADGFAHIVPSLAALALFAVGATLQILAMRQQEMTTTYIAVLGFEAVCAFVVGCMLLGEELTWQKVAGSIIVCVGVALLHDLI